MKLVVTGLSFFLLWGKILGLDVLSKLSDTKFNVHIIPHSHDDPGWLKTVDQYYSGTNSSIYTASVSQIFNSVVSELMKSGDRTFSFCEVSFFSRWWYEQDEKMKETVKYLFSNGQLSFLNGGWVMHDEASSHYVSMIDQTTLGHRFLVDELGYRPRVGWQIDPFGHSKTHAWLSNEVGFDALFFGRIDYQDREKRFREKSMEMIWTPSTADTDAEVFTGAFSDGNYGPPSDFCFDTTCPYCRNDPVVKNPLLQTYNLEMKIAKLLEGIQKEESITRGNHMMLKFGSDFAYSNAQSWYASIDILMAEINSRDLPYNLLYSDPTSYMRARAKEVTVPWPKKSDDFFPYSDASHTFWTGYFTSRPQFKFFERYASGYLQIVRQLTASLALHASSTITTSTIASLTERITELTAAIGLVNHHDSITGTEKQHVADDYKKILSVAVDRAEREVSKTLGLTSCRLVNETRCDVTQSLRAGDGVVVSVYNPLPRTDESRRLVTLLLSTESLRDADAVVVRLEDSVELLGDDNRMHLASLLNAMEQHSAESSFLRAEVFPVLTTADVFYTDPLYAHQQESTRRLVFTVDTSIAALSMKKFLVLLVPKTSDASSSGLQSSNPTASSTTSTTSTTTTTAIPVWVETVRNHRHFRAAETVTPHLSISRFPTTTALSVETNLLKLSFDPRTGRLTRIARSLTNQNNNNSTGDYNNNNNVREIVLDVVGAVGIGYYQGFGGSASSPAYRPLSAKDVRDPHLQNIEPHPEIVHNGASTQTSGTYIFRPSTPRESLHPACVVSNDLPTLLTAASSTPSSSTPTEVKTCADEVDNLGLIQDMVVLQGHTMVEVHQRFSNWASHVLRIRANSFVVDVEYQLGEIPVSADGIGKEVVYRIDTSLNTEVNVSDDEEKEGKQQRKSHQWFSDSNGREFMPRVYNYRPTWHLEVFEPIAGNYYPLTTAQYMSEASSSSSSGSTTTPPLQFSWLTDRSLGGGSLKPGSMEIMLHRRLLYDDFKGVEEALNETVGGILPLSQNWQRVGRGIPVTGQMQWIVSLASDEQHNNHNNHYNNDHNHNDNRQQQRTAVSNVGMVELRQQIDVLFASPAAASVFYQPWTVVADASSSSSSSSSSLAYTNTSSDSIAASVVFLSQDLPANIQLVTCEYLLSPTLSLHRLLSPSSSPSSISSMASKSAKKGNRPLLLVRLAHQFDVQEDVASMSQPVDVDLAAVFASFRPQRVLELTLSANQGKIAQLEEKIHWQTSTIASRSAKIEAVKKQQESMVVTLLPMQIRTFALFLS